jgi:hypothetical protein
MQPRIGLNPCKNSVLCLKIRWFRIKNVGPQSVGSCGGLIARSILLLADFVAEVGDWKTAPDRGEFLKAIYYARSMWRRDLCLIGIDTHNASVQGTLV